MERKQRDRMLRIGELASAVGMTPDTVRYYERLGLLGVPRRTESGYRLYTDADRRRLQFIRRAKLLSLSLDEIRSLLALAAEGECRPLRRQVADLLGQKIDECEAKLVELAAFKMTLEDYYRRALESQGESACECAAFLANCACLPVRGEEPHLLRGPMSPPSVMRDRVSR
ncbi:MAG: MerR family transcriptional regulator [Chloroflexi bacterium]|nr:MerR family transcriptional regulator [Chloroflexota bacterium]